MNRFLQIAGTTVLGAMALTLVGCNDGGGDGGMSSTGTASFDATDAPVDNVSEVRVTFDRIDLKPKNGDIVSHEFEPRTIDNLLELTGDKSEPILEDTTVPAGEYTWVRLYVVGGETNDQGNVQFSRVVDDNGRQFPLHVPGGQPQSQNSNSRFMQLNTGFVVPAGGDADFTIDFVLRKALTKPANQTYYLLRPAHRLIDNVEVGTISGTVSNALVNDSSCTEGDANPDVGNSVYLYTDFDAEVGDIYVDSNGDELARDSEVNPITTAEVVYDSAADEYHYTIGFVAEADYTLAFTCQAESDDPEADDAIIFADRANVSVTAGETATQNFAAP